MSQPSASQLPIEDQINGLLEALESGRDVLLSAPPGAGKSTVVPGVIADQPWCQGKVWVSQPRRLAAQALARRVAGLRQGRLGDEVGYSVRFDRQASAATRIEYMTAGLLLRRIQKDPFLEGVSCVVLDEFHERSLDSDFCLALLLQVQADARPDLRLVVMSATLNTEPLRLAMPAAQTITSQGRSFPVEIEYSKAGDEHISVTAARAAARALKDQGRVLVFLPGVGAIERCCEALKGSPATLLRLHGRLSKAEQNRVLEPCHGAQIILATNIAETSLTIDGVHTVVDSGLAHAPRYDARLGLSRLRSVSISRASAEQRAGRAGRLGPGRCIRLWSNASHHQRPAFDAAEILDAELSGSLLQILAWGQTLDAFSWFEAPPKAHQQRAIALLIELGAIDEDHRITAAGRRLAQLPITPRLGAVLTKGSQLGAPKLAAQVAAIASEPDFLNHRPPERCEDDLSYRIEQLKAPSGAVDQGGRKRVLRVAEQLVRLAPKPDHEATPDGQVLQRLMLAGFADRLARRNDDGSYALAAGYRAELDKQSRCHASDMILAVSISASDKGLPRIRAAIPVEPSFLERHQRLELRWDPTTQAVLYEHVERLGSLVLKRKPAPRAPDPDAVCAILFAALENQPERALNWSKDSIEFANRVRFCRHHGAHGLPDPDDQTELLKRICSGRRSVDELRRADLAQALQQSLDYASKQQIERWAPTRIKLPNGRHARVTYDDPGAPVVRSRVQDFFGLDASPQLAEGRAQAVCHLLAPNGRPAQVTADLAGFWSGSYSEVRKALRGRYPKHDWPEDPRLRNSS
jgi:ATP-dependent helicase HrpB